MTVHRQNTKPQHQELSVLRQHINKLEKQLREREQTEQTLRDRITTLEAQCKHSTHTQSLEAVAEHALDGIAIARPSGAITYANESFRRMTGFGDQVIGMSYMDFHPDDAHAQIKEELLPTMKQQGQWKGRIPAQRPDGTLWEAQISIATMMTPDDAEPQFIAIFRDLTAQYEQEQQLRTFQALLENVPDGVTLLDLDGTLLYANEAWCRMVGHHDATLKVNLSLFIPEAGQEKLQESFQAVMTQGIWRGDILHRHSDGTLFTAAVSAVLVRDADGQAVAVAGLVRDLSEQQRAEAERLKLQEEVIMAQQAALRELSTPLIPIIDGVVAMPLIGSIDSGRAQQVIETLLTGVAASHATVVILDITGVPVVDTQVASALLRAAQAVKLLGAEVMLTGIRPEVAQTLVGLGVNLSAITTRSTLQSGIASALAAGKRTKQ